MADNLQNQVAFIERLKEEAVLVAALGAAFDQAAAEFGYRQLAAELSTSKSYA